MWCPFGGSRMGLPTRRLAPAIEVPISCPAQEYSAGGNFLGDALPQPQATRVPTLLLLAGFLSRQRALSGSSTIAVVYMDKCRDLADERILIGIQNAIGIDDAPEHFDDPDALSPTQSLTDDVGEWIILLRILDALLGGRYGAIKLGAIHVEARRQKIADEAKLARIEAFIHAARLYQ
jgi:hypothetical protein